MVANVARVKRPDAAPRLHVFESEPRAAVQTQHGEVARFLRNLLLAEYTGRRFLVPFIQRLRSVSRLRPPSVLLPKLKKLNRGLYTRPVYTVGHWW